MLQGFTERSGGPQLLGAGEGAELDLLEELTIWSKTLAGGELRILSAVYVL